MSMTRIIVRMSWVALMLLVASGASGQDYPNKPIRFVTSDAGSNPDFNVRVIAPGLTERLGQPVVVVNIGGGIRSMVTVASAPPDGYTIYLTGTLFRPDPAPGENVPDLVRDFSPISLNSIAPTLLVIHPSLPVKTVRELIALAKARPGELNFASGSPGSVTHLAGELFKAMAGINIVVIPYKSAGPVITDLLGGHVQGGFNSAGSAIPHVKSGKMRALAIGSAEPSALFPALPTLASSGLPGYEAVTSYAIFALAKTPAPIINRLNQEIVRTLNQADVKEKLLNNGVEPIGSSPEALMGKVKAEIARVRKLIKDTGIKIE